MQELNENLRLVLNKMIDALHKVSIQKMGLNEALQYTEELLSNHEVSFIIPEATNLFCQVFRGDKLLYEAIMEASELLSKVEVKKPKQVKEGATNEDIGLRFSRFLKKRNELKAEFEQLSDELKDAGIKVTLDV